MCYKIKKKFPRRVNRYTNNSSGRSAKKGKYRKRIAKVNKLMLGPNENIPQKTPIKNLGKGGKMNNCVIMKLAQEMWPTSFERLRSLLKRTRDDRCSILKYDGCHPSRGSPFDVL